MDRRSFLQAGATVLSGAFLGGSARYVAQATAAIGDSPYGPLATRANPDGLRLPAGFTSRLLAVSGQRVAGTTYTWHTSPDGGACTARPDGGWVYISNGERSNAAGGVGVIAFDPAGSVVDAYSILSGTTRNCSGGMTPWGTYLSGEEHAGGGVYECDPLRPGEGMHRPQLGTFQHEMIAVDPFDGTVYMVEDNEAGRLYRFTPTRFGDLSSGRLAAANVTRGCVTWQTASTTAPDRSATTTAFSGAEGAWIMRGSLYLTTKLDVRVWRLDLAGQQLSVLYDHAAQPGASLDAVDNLVGHEPSGDLFVAEDGGNLEIGVVATVGPAMVGAFAQFVGHDKSEVTGLAFNPDRSRLYVTSQRGTDGVTGRTYEIRGPFRTRPRARIPSRRR